DVRRASPEEADEAFALLRRFFAEEGFTTPPEILRERFAVLLADQSGAVFLARRGEVAVGVATVTTTFGLEFGRSAELEDLYVLPHARDEGAGRALIDAARGWCRGLGCTTLGVVVTPEG
ncbi:MAG: GNAT family N-acetyltransferase, partial [Chloroflexota bacterium]|nr:GNAT family N-acetyltransferase [Chloroflexota bacterium]